MKQLTPNQQEYKKQLSRVKRIINKQIKAGYIFEDLFFIKSPKRITKLSIKKLKQLTPKELNKYASKIDISTGEIKPGIKIKRREAGLKGYQTRINSSKQVKKSEVKIHTPKKVKKSIQVGTTEKIDITALPRQSDIVLDNLLQELNNGKNKRITAYLIDILNDEIENSGREEVLKRIANYSEEIIQAANGAGFEDYWNRVDENATRFAAIITNNNISPFMRETIEDLAKQDSPYKSRSRIYRR